MEKNNKENLTFDLTKIKKKGLHTIEASAGTGKTYTLTSIYLWLLLQKIPIEKILVISYTNAATNEIKTRIKNQLFYLARMLQQEELGGIIQKNEKNSIASELLTKINDKKEAQKIVERAVENIDAAEISTFHSFCQKTSHFYALENKEVLGQNISAKEERFIKEAALEYWRKKYYREEENVFYAFMNKKEKALKFEKFLKYVAQLITQPCLKLCLPEESPEKIAREKKELQENFQKQPKKERETFLKNNANLIKLFHCEINEAVEEIKKSSKKKREKEDFLSFNDLVDFYEKLTEKKNFLEKMKKSYDILLVDEAQDCNERQISLLERIFSHQEKGIFYIGDLKQSIYSFQDATCHTFLQRIKSANVRFILETNYRTQKSLLHALHAWYQQNEKPFYVEKEELNYFPTKAHCDQQNDSGVAALRFFCLDGDKNKDSIEYNEVTLLKKMAQEIKKDIQKNPSNTIAILCLKGKEIKACIKELKKLKIPFSFQDKNETLEEILIIVLELLRCLETMDIVKIKSLLRSSLYDFPLYFLRENEEEYGNYFAKLKKTLEKKGVYSMILDLLHSPPPKVSSLPSLTHQKKTVAQNILGKSGGEEFFSQLKFITEKLAEEEKKITKKEWIKNSSNEWIKKLIKKVEILLQNVKEKERIGQASYNPASRVILSTIHASKGLEYDHVYLPYFAFYVPRQEDSSTAIFFKEDENNKKTRYLVFYPNEDQKNAFLEEEKKETARKLYVALTRAKKHLTIFLWHGSKKGGNDKNNNKLSAKKIAENPLYHLLFEKEEENYIAALAKKEWIKKENIQYEIYTKEEVEKRAKKNAQENVKIESIQQTKLQTKEKEEETLRFSAKKIALIDPPTTIKTQIYIESFSSIKQKLAFNKKKATEYLKIAEEEDHDDEINIFTFDNDQAAVEVGNFFHKIVENIDFSEAAKKNANSQTIILQQINEILQQHGISDEKQRTTYSEELLKWAMLTIVYPLGKDLHHYTKDGALPKDFSISLLKKNDFLTESTFFYPCHRPLFSPLEHEKENVAGLLSVVAQQHNKEKKNHYFLQNPTLMKNNASPFIDFKKGYIKGVIDLIFCVEGKYFLLDWKTNNLGAQAKNYCREKIESEMENNAYTLQHQIYSVALHRMLKQRLKQDYDCQKHFGGIVYFFTRGVLFAKDKPECCVYFHKPSQENLNHLEELFSFQQTS